METLATIAVAAIGLLSAVVVWFQLAKKLEIKKVEAAAVIDLRNVEAAEKIAELRDKNYSLQIEKIKTEFGLLSGQIETFKKEIGGFRTEIQAAVESVKGAEIKYVQTREKADEVFSALKGFVKQTDEKLKNVESHIVDLGGGKILVKGKKPT